MAGRKGRVGFDVWKALARCEMLRGPFNALLGKFTGTALPKTSEMNTPDVYIESCTSMLAAAEAIRTVGELLPPLLRAVQASSRLERDNATRLPAWQVSLAGERRRLNGKVVELKLNRAALTDGPASFF